MKQIILAIAIIGGLASTAAADQWNQERQGPGSLQGQCGEMRERRAGKKVAKRMRFERRMAMLRRFDANQDGWLSPQEQRAAREAFRAKRQARRDRARSGTGM
ncbi:MAG TPA: hypothetical protein VM261_29360 [Kofleriaceae bacterium]|nr:hypothetical protein [Kofleriaceae bacterium]